MNIIETEDLPKIAKLINHLSIEFTRRTTMPPEVELLQELDRDSNWVSENYDILQKYQGKVIAVRGQKIIAIQDSIEELLEVLEQKKEDPALLLIEAIPQKDVAFIL
ncbi:hypothetical protein KAU88_10070 [Candidatus Bathyarchaeota archaeon]|nr:hypothetical protein [Candidatus Bathyarchaeota archaeon]